jgi:1-acyl-sn-glycerol-3-phosphate acyltransferase
MSDPENWRYEPAADLAVPWSKRPASELRESGLTGGLGNWALRQLVRLYLRARHPLTFTGAEHLPQQTPFVLVANHTSHLDAMVLESIFPEHLATRVFALAAGDYFFDTPTKRLAAAQLVNALPVWRGKATRHALANLRERLERGTCGFIVFPEGTRSRTGELQPFKPGIGMLVAGSSIPVIPCTLRGCFESWPSNASGPRPGAIHLTIHPARTFADVPNHREGWERIAAELQAAVYHRTPSR